MTTYRFSAQNVSSVSCRRVFRSASWHSYSNIVILRELNVPPFTCKNVGPGFMQRLRLS